jgi:hypothetical protein
VPDVVSRRTNEEGALLIILMVGVAVAMVGIAVAFQSWSIVWRRDSEEELIFRGQQYVEAIKAYRKEHGNACPPNLEELMKPGPRQVRYIRKLFKDPMIHNGKWGLLYLTPDGRNIYDPVAAQRTKDRKESGQASDDTMNVSGGLTPISDPMGAMGQPGQLQVPGSPGPGGVFGPGGGRSPGGGMQGGNLQQKISGLMGGGGGFQRVGGGGFGGAGGGMGGMALPPPIPASTMDDEKSVSEPPIGWPIVGVISRATGKTADDTYKIYKGHEHVNEWQFHVFDMGLDQTQAPGGTLPGGSPPPFLGPGFGGQGPIGGIGGGPKPGNNPRTQGPINKPRNQ